MTSATTNNATDGEELSASDGQSNLGKLWKDWIFSGLVLLDVFSSLFLLTPYLQPSMTRRAMDEPDDHHLTFYGSLVDLAILSALRLLAILAGLWIAFHRPHVIVPSPFRRTSSSGEQPPEHLHPNGDKKSQEELDEEALEEPFFSWLVRFTSRPSFPAEVTAVLTQLLCIVKCLARMELELDRYHSKHPIHPLFWMVVVLTAVLSMMEAILLDGMCRRAGQFGKERVAANSESQSDLGTPLLDSENEEEDLNVAEENMDTEAPDNNADSNTNTDDEVRGVSDIQADTTYKVSWRDVLWSCAPDLPLIFSAFVFLILAAIAEVCIPRFLGNILDSLTETFGGGGDDDNHDMPMWDVPGFLTNVQLLLLAAIAAGVFAGIRAAMFTIAGGRVNIRLRIQLMDSLMSQDVSFFDMTKTGDITSRLSSDTTLVGNQAIRSIDVLFKCLVHCLGVLAFMFAASWQLTVLAFITFPVTAILSKWFGNYMRLLSKLMQKKLADGNSVSEAALSSMATVRSFDAGESELEEFEKCMQKYLYFQKKNAIAFGSFITMIEALPQLVFAVVVFYGGLQVRNGDLTVGQLVSFLLYLQALSDEFAAIGYVFGNLTQAVGAADKIFELMNREPKYTRPSAASPSSTHPVPSDPSIAVPGQSQELTPGVLGVKATKTRAQRTAGLWPEDPARGEIVLDNVEMYYPARPLRRVLNRISLKVPAGSTVAIVGKSGSGKSSIMGLIQHLYEPTAGRILFDGNDVLDLSSAFLSRNISIVSQEPTLFARSIKKNVIYGLEGTNAEPSDEEIIQAAKLANADSFIQKMPQKYDTEVGERGIQLSGGQKQRIAIARALVRYPRVLLLDEATSALDAESEHLVQQAIDDMLARSKAERGAMTVLIVAHRLSTVRNADKIFVIEEGHVVEEGHHTQLIENPDGAYSCLVRRQMEAQEKLEEKT